MRKACALLLLADPDNCMHDGESSYHRALVPFAGRAILGRTVNALVDSGIQQIFVEIGGSHAGDIREYLAEHHGGIEFKFLQADANVNGLESVLTRGFADGADIFLSRCDCFIKDCMLSSFLALNEGNWALTGDGAKRTSRLGLASPTEKSPGNLDQSVMASELTPLNFFRLTRDSYVKLSKAGALGCLQGTFNSARELEEALASIGSNWTLKVAASGEWRQVDAESDILPARFALEPESRAELIEQTWGGYWAFDMLDFGYVRNVHFPPQRMLNQVADRMSSLSGNYGSVQKVLDKKLARFLGCPPGEVVLLSGAAQSYPPLGKFFAGQRVAVPYPTFGEYNKIFPDAVKFPDRLDGSIEGLDLVSEKNQLVVIVNPNNPTGTTWATEELAALARRHPETHYLVDESFLIFSEQPSLRTLARNGGASNISVLSSLGKLLGVPGLRLGYFFSTDPAVYQAVVESLPIWNISGPSEFFLELLPLYQRELDLSIELTKNERASFATRLCEMDGVDRVYPSGADFLLVELCGTPELADWIFRRLLAEDCICVRNVSQWFGEEVARLRVAVRSAKDNKVFAAALAKKLAERDGHAA